MSQPREIQDRWDRLQQAIGESAKAGAGAFKSKDAATAAQEAVRIKRIEGYLTRALMELDRGLAYLTERG